MRVGMFGLRGLHPDLEISGFETAFAEIAPRLAARGMDITMYCRASAHSASQRRPRSHDIELLYMPSPGGKNYSALVSTGMAVLHALLFRRFDVWFFVNVGMGHHCMLARLSGRPVVINVDGLDWTRAKWGRVARWYFKSAARAAVRWCTRLVTDAEAMRTYYREHFGRDSTMIPYGADVVTSEHPERIASFGVTPGEYVLIVSRLIPENSLLMMLDGFRQSSSKRRLLVVGGATYENAFHAELRRLAEGDARIAMVGQITDQTLLNELWCNCAAYLHGHSVGGTNPALLRAMGAGCVVLALDTPFNREALADTGHYFRESADVTSLVDALDSAMGAGKTLGARAQARVKEHYTWEGVADDYEALFRAESASTLR